MDLLAPEVLFQICACARDDDRNSLYSLSLVNHRFYEVAAPLIYETLTVRFSDDTSLKRVVTEIKENHLRRQYLIHARRVNLMAIPDIQQEFIDDDGSASNLEFPCPDEFLRPRDIIPDTYNSPGFFFRKEKDWEPLVALIASMRYLTELHYALANMFPKCLLQVIHDCHPTCRLSIWGWQELGLHEPGLEGLAMSTCPEFDDPFEMDLLRSHCLHAISLWFYSGGRHPDYVSHSIFPRITMAPNLKHVYLRHGACREDDPGRSNRRWDDYIATLDPVYTANVVSLTFVNSDYFDLPEWSKSTDFSSLRSLEISRLSQPLELMTYLSGLKNLECLSLLNISKWFDSSVNFEDELHSMFAGLNPLKYLRICGTRDTSLIHEIFAHHGETLRGFILEPLTSSWTFLEREEQHPLYPVFTYDDITAFAAHSRYLEELRLPIERSRGDKMECQLYEALSKFPSLRRLILDMDCNPRQRLDRDQAAHSEDTWKSRIQEIFINAAMDEMLVRSIWGTINSSDDGGPLRSLRITVFGEESLPRSVREVIRYLARSFLIEKSYTGVGVHLREIGRKEQELRAEREWRWKHFFEWRAGRKIPAPKFPRKLQPVIQSLWPSASGEVMWNFAFESLPLQVGSTWNN